MDCGERDYGKKEKITSWDFKRDAQEVIFLGRKIVEKIVL